MILSHRYILLLIACTVLLSVPLVAMQFTNEVNWSIFDFLVAAVLLYSAATSVEFIMQKVKKTILKIVLMLVLAMMFSILWLELAVGLFGSPIAGS